MKRILITGAKGFVGYYLANHLESIGYEIIRYYSDITSSNQPKEVFKNVDIVIHLAARLDNVSKRPEDFFVTNVIGTHTIVKLCIEYNCKLINFSSASAERRRGSYGISKAVAEELVASYAGYDNPLRAVTIRPVALYDYRGYEREAKPAEMTKGLWYPMHKLLALVLNILEHEDFRRYKVYKTTLFSHKIIKLKLAIKRIIGKKMAHFLKVFFSV